MDFWCNFCHVIFVVIFSTRSPNWEDIWCNFCCSLYENIIIFVALKKCPIQPPQNWEDIYIESKIVYTEEKKKYITNTPPYPPPLSAYTNKSTKLTSSPTYHPYNDWLPLRSRQDGGDIDVVEASLSRRQRHRWGGGDLVRAATCSIGWRRACQGAMNSIGQWRARRRWREGDRGEAEIRGGIKIERRERDWAGEERGVYLGREGFIGWREVYL